MQTLCHIFNNTVERFPEKEALVYAEQRFTWLELSILVKRLSVGLGNSGVKEGDVVALWLTPSPCFVVSYLAVLALGATVMPLNTSLKQGDINALSMDFKYLITSQSLTKQLHNNINVSALALEQLWVSPDNSFQYHWSLMADSNSEASIAVLPDTPAILMFSSGSTGVPKKLARTHRQCVSEIFQSIQAMNVTQQDNVFSALPLYHAHGMANAFWVSLATGASLVLFPLDFPLALQVRQIITTLHKQEISVLPGIPFIYELLASWPEDEVFDHLRLSFSAGSPLKPSTYELLQKKMNICVRQLYGCTEAGAISINMDDITEVNQYSVGKPFDGINLEILGSEGQLLPHGQIGEINFQSKALTSGYINNPVANHDSFHNGWYATGDMGHYNTDGSLSIVGRKAFVMDIAGRKVFLNEVESVLEQHSQVKEAAVKAINCNGNVTGLEAFVVVKTPLSSEVLINYCIEKLPSYKCPRVINLRTSLPKTSTGKLQRNKL